MEWLNGLSNNSGTTLMMWMVMVIFYTARDEGQGYLYSQGQGTGDEGQGYLYSQGLGTGDEGQGTAWDSVILKVL